MRLVKGYKDYKGVETSVYKETRQLRLFSLEGLTNFYECPVEASKEETNILVLPSHRTRGNEHEVKYAFKHKQNLSLSVVEHLNRGVSVLRGRQNLIKYDPGKSAVDDPHLSRKFQY